MLNNGMSNGNVTFMWLAGISFNMKVIFSDERIIVFLMLISLIFAGCIAKWQAGQLGYEAEEFFSEIEPCEVYKLSLIHISEPTRPY